MIARTHMIPRHFGNQTGNYVRSSIGRLGNLQRCFAFLSVASALMVIGCVLTGMGYPRLPNARMTGPILMALSLLFVMFATREYFVFRQNKIEMRRLQFQTTGVGALAALTVTSNDRLGAITFVMDTCQPQEPNADSPAVDGNPPTYTQATAPTSTTGSNIFTSFVDPSHDVTSVEEPPSYEDVIHGIQGHSICPQQQTIVLTTVPGLSQAQVVPVTGYVVNLPVPQPPITTPQERDEPDNTDNVDNNNRDGNNNTGQDFNTTSI